MSPKVSIIILNWNSWKDTIECLESVFRIDYPNYQVIIVDNGSTDDSVEKIKEWAEGKTLVESKFFEYDPNNKPILMKEFWRIDIESNVFLDYETLSKYYLVCWSKSNDVV
jgi:GT2 family glycosyltransferase